MSQNETNTPAETQNTVLATLDGRWFRRERERIAVGRKRLAERLGTTENRLGTLETKGLPVVQQWLPILSDLGFRIPGSVQKTEQESAQPQDIGNTLPGHTPTPMTDHNQVPETTSDHAESGLHPMMETETETTVNPTEPSRANTDAVQTAEGDSSPESTLLKAQARPTGSFFRGHWLRDRLAQNAVDHKKLRESLGCSETELRLRMELDLPLPSRFIKPLHQVSLLNKEEYLLAIRTRHETRFDGIWLTRQRAALRLTPANCADLLNIDKRDLVYIEARVLPLPESWPSLIDEYRKNRGLRSHADVSVFKPRFGAGGRSAPKRSSESSAKASVPACAKAEPRLPKNSTLAQTIVENRLLFGKQIGASAHEVLVLIAQDLRAAKAHVVIGHDTLQAAMKVLVNAPD